MNTYSHGFFTYAALRGHPDCGLAVAGAVMPDMPFIVGYPFFAGLHGVSHETWVANKKNPVVRTAVKITHSILTWLVASICIMVLAPECAMFLWGWLSHICLDFCTHNHAAHAHFYPLSDWRYRSPISFYERNYYGRQFIAAEHTTIALFLVLWTWHGALQQTMHQVTNYWQAYGIGLAAAIAMALVGFRSLCRRELVVMSEAQLASAEFALPVEAR